MIRAIAWVFILWAALFGAIVAIHERGDERTPAHVSAILPDPTCKAPCWQGIRPTLTPPKDANTILSAMGDRALGEDQRWTLNAETDHPVTVTLRETELRLAPTDLRLGEVILAYGEPDYSFLFYMSRRVTWTGRCGCGSITRPRRWRSRWR